MARVEFTASERVHYRQIREVPDDQVASLAGMTSEDIIEQFIDRSDVYDSDDADVSDFKIKQ